MRNLEPLEGRWLFASYAAATVPELVTAINAANASPEADTITLAAGATFSLTAVDNITYFEHPNGLPVVAAAGGELTVLGNGATVERSAAPGTPAFRLLYAEFGSSLTLTDLTLQGGFATTGFEGARGGAIYAEGGGLHLENVIVQNNRAVGADGATVASFSSRGQSAEGGGIYAWSFTAVNCTIRDNVAQGGRGADGAVPATAKYGGDALGGGIFGSGSMTDCVITGNVARGGDAGIGPGVGGVGGWAVGGGAYLYGGTFRGVTVTRNAAIAGSGEIRKAAGESFGGGIYSALGTVEMDAFTARNVKHNTAATAKNIAGGYIKIV